jgi:hypothetical protein
VFLRTLDDHVVAPCRRTCFTHLHCSISACQARSTLACWCGTPHLVTLDALLASKHQFSARSHGTRVWPRVAFPRGQVRPRNLVHWHSNTASVLRSETGLVSWSRIWTKFSAYCILHTIRTLVHFLTSQLGPFSDLRTWAVFGRALTTFREHACPELSKVRVALETLIDNVPILFISYYDSTSHTQFVGHHARTHGPPRHDTHTCFGIGRASDS